MELGCAKHFGHNIVDGVACNRSMDKRVFRCASSSCHRDMWGPVQHWLKALSIFWLMDAETVAVSRNGSQSHENTNVCSAEVLLGPHFRSKWPQAECNSRTKDCVLLRDDSNGQGGRMERRRVGGIEIRGVYVDFTPKPHCAMDVDARLRI